MKTLLLLRHAKSSWANMQLADHKRPLNNRGKQDAPRMGHLLQKEGATPQLIISSTAERARQTAEAVATASQHAQEILFADDLYLASPYTILEIVRESNDVHDRVMVVAHNPGMETLVEMLTGVKTRFTTANIAHIELPIERWAMLDHTVQGRLLNLWRPKEIENG